MFYVPRFPPMPDQRRRGRVRQTIGKSTESHREATPDPQVRESDLIRRGGRSDLQAVRPEFQGRKSDCQGGGSTLRESDLTLMRFRYAPQRVRSDIPGDRSYNQGVSDLTLTGQICVSWIQV